MRISHLSRSLALLFSLSVLLTSPAVFAGISLPKPVAEWTFLTYINGNNNLDSYGAKNINQMETVGSSDQINIVVQWASLKRGTTQRMLIKKDSDTSKVTSPVIQEIKGLDMGNWRSLVEFVQWAHDNYPAKHYFINVWNHGNGWHLTDISWDDKSGNFITTKQLGDAIREAAQIIGHKVDIYASDACLMAMVEVANEMKDSVEVFAGSEETEPGDGWPYNTFLSRWSALDNPGAKDVAKILAEEYAKAYTNGVFGKEDVTFSAFDLSRIEPLNQAVKDLGAALLTTDKASKSKAVSAANTTLHFTYNDYSDLSLYTDELEKAKLTSVSTDLLRNVRGAIGDFVIANQATGRYARAKGVSMWIPTSQTTYDKFSTKYDALQFAGDTGWSTTLKFLLGTQ